MKVARAEGGAKGGRPKRGTEKPCDASSHGSADVRPAGNGADRLTARIKRDHPVIAARMEAGEFASVRAAALDVVTARRLAFEAAEPVKEHGGARPNAGRKAEDEPAPVEGEKNQVRDANMKNTRKGGTQTASYLLGRIKAAAAKGVALGTVAPAAPVAERSQGRPKKGTRKTPETVSGDSDDTPESREAGKLRAINRAPEPIRAAMIRALCGVDEAAMLADLAARRKAELLAIEKARQGARVDLTSVAKHQKSDAEEWQTKTGRAIGRAPEVVRDLYCAGLIGQKEAARESTDTLSAVSTSDDGARETPGDPDCGLRP